MVQLCHECGDSEGGGKPYTAIGVARAAKPPLVVRFSQRPSQAESRVSKLEKTLAELDTDKSGEVDLPEWCVSESQTLRGDGALR